MPTTTKTRMTGYEARHKLRRASYRSAHVRTKVRAYVMRKPIRLRRVRLYDDFHMGGTSGRESEGTGRETTALKLTGVPRVSSLSSSSEMYMPILMPIRFMTG